MEHCDNCQNVLNQVYQLENQVASLKNSLEIAITQTKLLKQENELLRSNIKIEKKQKNPKEKTSLQIKQCLEEIEKLQQIIKHKDEIIQSQIRCDDISESGVTDTIVQQDQSRKRVKI